MNGWAGTILRVDLTKGKITKEQLNKSLTANFLGGRGINVNILFNEVPAKIDAFSPDNKVIFGVGPLVGTGFPTCGRFNTTGKSPLTGLVGDANSGGHFGPEVKYAGYDNIVFSGRSEKPVYLSIEDEQVEIKDASHIWGKNTRETDRILKEDHGDKNVQVACIGQAGENLVRFSAVICNLARAAARTGIGAVIGSKNLKAIAVRGTKGVDIADPDKVKELIDGALYKIRENRGAQRRSVYGTAMLVDLHREHSLCVRNLQFGNFDRYEQVNGNSLVDNSKKSKSCFACPIHCSHFCVVKEGPYAGIFGEGVEYETILQFGPMADIDYLPAIIQSNNLCNQYGLDTGSVGPVISWAMECYEKGILTERDFDGMKPTWGNYEVFVKLIHKIANREGIGDLLAEGVKMAAEKVGRDSEKFALHIKGLELASELRVVHGFALGHAVSTRGADHLRGAATCDNGRQLPEEQELKFFGSVGATNPHGIILKGKLVQWYEQVMAIADAVGICKFALSPFAGMEMLKTQEISEILSAATGIAFDEKQLLNIGERIMTVERAFNVREGATRKDDTVPYRIMYEPIPDGWSKGMRISPENLDKMLDDYYESHGWDKYSGMPTEESYSDLGLQEIATSVRNIVNIPKRSGVI